MKSTAIFSILSVIFISAFSVNISAATVDLEVSVSNPYLIADQQQSIFLKVGLTGLDLGEERRTPANVSIVLDRSGSMDGEKMARAKEAASIAISMLDARDIVSIVTYSDTVSVLVPATRVSNRNYIQSKIESVLAGGSTALFAGVSKGADEVSKFLERNSVNRVILLSDGLANIGPDSPRALGSLGESLKRSGVSVTTIGLGLGYNEDLMVQLAKQSDGNHAFVENYNDLTRIFRYEFQDILSVVAQDVEIEISCPDGVVPLRILGREAEIIGGKVYTTINQLYSNQEKYLLVELTVPAGQAGSSLNIADVSINYANMQSKKTDNIARRTGVEFTRSEETVVESVDKDTVIDAVRQISAQASEEAIILRDEGKVEEAQAVLKENTNYLYGAAAAMESEELYLLGDINNYDAEAIEDDEDWNASRKRMKASSFEIQNQQDYSE
jgi:Ca-activated chloride channel family protein